jgi:hypothetical protein
MGASLTAGALARGPLSALGYIKAQAWQRNP